MKNTINCMFVDALNTTDKRINQTFLRAVIRRACGALTVTESYSAPTLKEVVKEYTDAGHTFVKYITEDDFNRIMLNRNK